MERLTETNNCIRFMEIYLNVDCKVCQHKGAGKCEEFKDECKAVADFKRFVKNMYSKLKDCEDLEEQGKLLKLPVAVGDMVYHLCAFSSGESEIIEMKVCCVEPCGAIRNHKGICEVWNVYAEADYTKAYFKFFDFGKTVFLTRPEAEKALEEMEGNNGNRTNSTT